MLVLFYIFAIALVIVSYFETRRFLKQNVNPLKMFLHQQAISLAFEIGLGVLLFAWMIFELL